MKNLFIIFSILLLASCSKEAKIDREKFTSVYAETLLISAKTTLSDSSRKSQIDSLLSINHLTESEFKTTVKELSEKPEEWRDIYKEILEKVEQKKQRTK